MGKAAAQQVLQNSAAVQSADGEQVKKPETEAKQCCCRKDTPEQPQQETCKRSGGIGKHGLGIPQRRDFHGSPSKMQGQMGRWRFKPCECRPMSQLMNAGSQKECRGNPWLQIEEDAQP